MLDVNDLNTADRRVVFAVAVVVVVVVVVVVNGGLSDSETKTSAGGVIINGEKHL
jgi:low temperature requirement protein LtrA